MRHLRAWSEDEAVGDGGPEDGPVRWEAMCLALEGPGSEPWPGEQARQLYDAVDAWLAHGDESDVDAAARRWASTAPMSVVVRRIGTMRELFIGDGMAVTAKGRQRLQRALDRVTTVATETAMAELREAALTDSLTDLGNRRAMELAGRAAVASALRTGSELSVAVFDLDGLKTINDTDGHAAGDKALAGLSASLRVALRQTDQLFRIGGDEFVALLPGANRSEVAEMTARAAQFNAPSFSWGAASVPEDGIELPALIEVADSRLYASRRRTRLGGVATPSSTEDVHSPSPQPRRRHRAQGLAAVLAAASVALVAWLAGPGPTTAKFPNTTPQTVPGATGSGTPAGQGSSSTAGAGASVTGATAGTAGTLPPNGTPGPGPAPSGMAPPGSSGGSGAGGPPPTSTTTIAPILRLPPPPTGQPGPLG